VNFRRSIFLSTRDVSKREGVAVQTVSHWCRLGVIWPIHKHGSVWLIADPYTLARSTDKGGRQRLTPLRVKGKPGRPPGSKNRRPYPKGVKRPRKPKPAGAPL
jgi:hypothetical protein